MSEINNVAVVVAAFGGFAASSVWYVVLGNATMALRGIGPGATAGMQNTPAWKMLGEFVRSLVVAAVLAYAVVLLGVVDLLDAVQLGVLVWIGFPVVLLVGSVMWEDVPWKLGAIHAGDWFVKLLVLAVIVGLWR